LIPIKGYTQEVESIYIQAQQLCQQVGETPQIFPALRGLLATYAQRGKLQTAREHAETFLRLAQRQGDSALLLQAHRILASIWLHLGAFACAREHVERGLALYNVQHHRSQTFLYAQDPGISCLTYAALSLWCLGYPDQALQTCQKALALARALAQPHSLAFAHSSAATLYQHRHEVQQAREQAEASIALCREQGFAFRSERGTILLGWALTRQGQQEEGMTQMHQSLAAHRMAGIELGLAYYLALLAEGYRQAGQGEEGLTALTEALATAHRTGDRWCEAELYRLQGEFLLQQDDSHQQQAEACFQQALVLARQQQAKSWELRAAMSLGRLWHQHGEREAARQMLAPVYNWFTEGFDTVDLQQAKTLLEAWSR
jgi:predicted ATPase